MDILDFSNSLPDFREAHKIAHLSTDIVFITVAVVICGAEDWEGIEYFGRCKKSFFLQIPRVAQRYPLSRHIQPILFQH